MITRFDLGRVVSTPGALHCLEQAGVGLVQLLARHATGDWGDLCPDDWVLNDRAVEEGERILSAYPLSTGERVYVITEADRSVTTLLLPSEY